MMDRIETVVVWLSLRGVASLVACSAAAAFAFRAGMAEAGMARTASAWTADGSARPAGGADCRCRNHKPSPLSSDEDCYPNGQNPGVKGQPSSGGDWPGPRRERPGAMALASGEATGRAWPGTSRPAATGSGAGVLGGAAAASSRAVDVLLQRLHAARKGLRQSAPCSWANWRVSHLAEVPCAPSILPRRSSSAARESWTSRNISAIAVTVVLAIRPIADDHIGGARGAATGVSSSSFEDRSWGHGRTCGPEDARRWSCFAGLPGVKPIFRRSPRRID